MTPGSFERRRWYRISAERRYERRQPRHRKKRVPAPLLMDHRPCREHAHGFPHTVDVSSARMTASHRRSLPEKGCRAFGAVNHVRSALQDTGRERTCLIPGPLGMDGGDGHTANVAAAKVLTP